MSSPAFPASFPPRPHPSVVLELLKPVTWFPPMWAFGCGVVSSGVALSETWPFALAGIALAGPLLCGTSQAVNDWFDRHVDAINEPDRPIPSGRMAGRWGLYVAVFWTALSIAVAAALGPVVLSASLLGLALAWAYSAPPLRLKRNGWWGNAAVGLSYEGLAWVTGAAAVLGGALPGAPIVAMAACYSVGAHGIMTLNDFKSIEGDRRVGIDSLPAQLGVDRAARLACATMILAQVVVIVCLGFWGAVGSAAWVGVLLVAQLVLMVRFLGDPRERAIEFSGFGVSLYVLGMAVTAFALRSSA